ncbi:DUF3951 domain-containing protein [Mesobacillus zeae]|uniref:DUF3951 domain-containing protein n=1 Tax=Mesobacillus zeae TaxID=1917180 RepID=A0A398B8C7_9BACI|nr:DUF3951 domain-containing protein [Mesobacillus zeae]RID85751.1 DUF3951 domain-containing protein [Mesobacillus zeae]
MLPIVLLICIVLFKLLFQTQKKSLTIHYLPFDTVTGNTSVTFHEEQNKEEDEAGEGDDKNRN